MNTENANKASQYKVIFGEINYDEKDKEIKMPPQKAHEKYIENVNENFVDLVVHKNTREILKKLEEKTEKADR